MNEQKKQGELKRTIGLPLLVGFGLAYLAPTTACGPPKAEQPGITRSRLPLLQCL